LLSLLLLEIIKASCHLGGQKNEKKRFSFELLPYLTVFFAKKAVQDSFFYVVDSS